MQFVGTCRDIRTPRDCMKECGNQRPSWIDQVMRPRHFDCNRSMLLIRAPSTRSIPGKVCFRTLTINVAGCPNRAAESSIHHQTSTSEHRSSSTTRHLAVCPYFEFWSERWLPSNPASPTWILRKRNRVFPRKGNHCEMFPWGVSFFSCKKTSFTYRACLSARIDFCLIPSPYLRKYWTFSASGAFVQSGWVRMAASTTTPWLT